MCGMISQALGPVINSGECTSVHRILMTIDNVMLGRIHYLSNGIHDTSEMTKNNIKQKVKPKEKHN